MSKDVVFAELGTTIEKAKYILHKNRIIYIIIGTILVFSISQQLQPLDVGEKNRN